MAKIILLAKHMKKTRLNIFKYVLLAFLSVISFSFCIEAFSSSSQTNQNNIQEVDAQSGCSCQLKFDHSHQLKSRPPLINI